MTVLAVSAVCAGLACYFMFFTKDARERREIARCFDALDYVDITARITTLNRLYSQDVNRLNLGPPISLKLPNTNFGVLRNILDLEAALRESERAFQALGSNAVPFLIEQLMAKDPAWKTKWNSTIQSRKWLSIPTKELLMFERAPRKRYKAVYACGLLGPAAGEALPWVTNHFPKIGGASLVYPVFPSKTVFVKGVGQVSIGMGGGDNIAIRTIGLMGNRAEAAIPLLEDIANSGFPGAAGEAGRALIRLRPHFPDRIDACLRRISMNAPQSAVLNSCALEFLKLWYEKINDSSLNAHERSNRMRDAVEWLRYPNFPIQARFIYYLGQLGPDAAPAVPVLIEMLDSESAKVRLKTAVALGRIGPASAPALPKLREIMETEVDNNNRIFMKRAIGRILK